MNMIKKVTIIALIITVAISLFATTSYCEDNANFEIGAFEDPGEVGNVKKLVNDTSATIITAARMICATLAIVILLVISMKYMTSAPGDRADIKKHAVHYVISAIILFGVTGILGIISKFAAGIKPEG